MSQKSYQHEQGLVVTDLVIRDGREAVKGALITAHYVGTLTDGTEFDSSFSRGRAFECVIGTRRVIQGWDLGVLGFMATDGTALPPMRVGGKRHLQVPAALGYAERAVGKIPANSDLMFEIELLEVRTRDD